LCLSLGWRFDAPPATFSALSLVVGIALASSLRRVGVAAAYLKWPNDVVCGHAKLAGILIEMRAEAGGPSDTVIGIGLNMRLSRDARAHIDQAVTDMYECGAHELARNRLAGLVLADLSVALDDFAEHGFAPYRARWAELDGLTGESVLVSLPGREVAGVARGVDEHGALVVEHAGGREIFLSGHVRRI
jgi:BirA family biotin operon repressor/biotin-[acetyl-CoA-carboxylase] ligase